MYFEEFVLGSITNIEPVIINKSLSYMSIGLHNRPFYSLFMNSNEKEQGISHLAPIGYMLFSLPNWNL